jgi:hypothetical protein
MVMGQNKKSPLSNLNILHDLLGNTELYPSGKGKERRDYKRI